jgi:very-short-patch-repair endonuclease
MHDLWRPVLDRAGASYGLTTRTSMRAGNLTDRMIGVAVADGLLVRVAPEVFAVRGAPRSERTAIAAATLATGGVVSHPTAGGLLRLDLPLPAVPIEVTVDAAVRHPRLRRIDLETSTRSFHPVRVHRAGHAGEPVLVVDGIRCRDAARTLFDVAPRLDVDALEDAFERARRLGLVSPTSLARRFERLGGPGRPGSAKVRALLERTRPGPLDSKLEGRVWRLLRASRLPVPVRQLRVDVARGRWYRIDFARPELLVGIEAEGFEWHGSRAQWKADRVRIATLERRGWRILVVTWDDVTLRPEETLERIAMAFAERRALLRSA